jgi:hypothetical protein
LILERETGNDRCNIGLLMSRYQLYAKLIIRSTAIGKIAPFVQNKHQKDNLSHSDIFWALQGSTAFYSIFL